MSAGLLLYITPLIFAHRRLPDAPLRVHAWTRAPGGAADVQPARLIPPLPPFALLLSPSCPFLLLLSSSTHDSAPADYADVLIPHFHFRCFQDSFDSLVPLVTTLDANYPWSSRKRVAVARHRYGLQRARQCCPTVMPIAPALPSALAALRSPTTRPAARCCWPSGRQAAHGLRRTRESIANTTPLIRHLPPFFPPQSVLQLWGVRAAAGRQGGALPPGAPAQAGQAAPRCAGR